MAKRMEVQAGRGMGTDPLLLKTLVFAMGTQIRIAHVEMMKCLVLASTLFSLGNINPANNNELMVQE